MSQHPLPAPDGILSLCPEDVGFNPLGQDKAVRVTARVPRWAIGADAPEGQMRGTPTEIVRWLRWHGYRAELA